MRPCVPHPASLVLIATVLLPAAARAQSPATSSGHGAAAQVILPSCLACPGLPPPPRLEPPAREVSIRLAASTAAGAMTGPGVSYSRQIGDAFAVEGALDLASEDDRFGLALLQLRVTSDPLVSHSRFVTLGIARVLGADAILERQGVRGYGYALGGGSQLRATDHAGARAEVQLLALGGIAAIRFSVSAFVGFGDR